MKLRRTRILTVLLATGALAGTASAANWRPRVGFEGAVNGGRLAANSRLGDGDHWKLGGSAGLVSRWSIAPGWSLEAAPGWERQVRRGTGQVWISSGGVPADAASYEQSVRLDRVLLPIRAAFRAGASGWSLEGGAVTAWLVDARHDSELILTPMVRVSPSTRHERRRAEPTAAIFESVGTFDNADWTHQFHRWDAAVTAGAGWDQPVAGRMLRGRVRWQQGLTNLAKAGEPLRLSSVSATVGVLW